MKTNRHKHLIKIIYFQCLLRRALHTHVLLETGKMLTEQKTLFHAVLKITYCLFSQVLSAHAFYCIQGEGGGGLE